jgi:hypothetical protein
MDWHHALDVLLTRASRRRDDSLWHMMTASGDSRHRDGTVSDVEVSPTTAIDSHSSSEVISYEAIGTAASAAAAGRKTAAGTDPGSAPSSSPPE